jgi:hypothetical protein
LNNNKEKNMITAKEAFEATKQRAQKVKEEKLQFVDAKIKEAVDREMLGISLSMINLKPFVGAVVEKLTESGFKVTQTATGLDVSWDLSAKPVKQKAVAAVQAKVEEPPLPEDDDFYEDCEDEEDEDDSQRW